MLKTDVILELIRQPSLLRQQLLATDAVALREHVILDEVQKVAQLLDEVQGLIESHRLRFIMCGSSELARRSLRAYLQDYLKE